MIFGADFSSLEETERLGGKFYSGGARGDAVELLADSGVTWARLRLWNDPFSALGESYGAGTCDFRTVVRLAKRAKDAGMKWLLDLHYSDFWCDPQKQRPPKAWEGLGLPELCSAVGSFTSRVLGELERFGVTPDAVQVGNEITNGMLWPVGKLPEDDMARGYDALAQLLDAGTKAVYRSSPARVMLHLERSGDEALWRGWLDNIIGRGVRFDDIGASYYPFWHGGLDALKKNLDAVSARYGRDIYIVETAYPFTAERSPAQGGVRLCADETTRAPDGGAAPYPLTPHGQAQFVRDLLGTVGGVAGGRGRGVFWWEPCWLPVPGTSWASRPGREYTGEDKPLGSEWANQCLFDYGGEALPALGVYKQCFDRGERG